MKTLLLLATLTATAAEPQLNIDGFAQCLSQKQAPVRFEPIQSRYQFSNTDFILPYLAVYAGNRMPLIRRAQEKAHKRWAESWETLESELVRRLAPLGVLTPDRLYAEALTLCSADDVFCAVLTTHNVLRTLGRHTTAIEKNGRDNNPVWFKSERDHWLGEIPKLQENLFSLRRNNSGDRWGDWYHFFGVFVFAIHELALNGEIDSARYAARMNQILNPIFTGHFQDPDYAQVDRDAVEVVWKHLKGTAEATNVDCSSREAYVLGSGRN
jgi:hypothetical protein